MFQNIVQGVTQIKVEGRSRGLRKRQYKRTEPHCTATNSSAPLGGNEAYD